MKRATIVLLTLAFLSGFSIRASAQNLAPGYYVVVAAYLQDQESFAKTYSEKIAGGGREAKYGFDATRNFYYVYLHYTTDFGQALSWMEQARKDGFENSWVRIMKGLPEAPVTENKNPAPAPAGKTTTTVAPPIAAPAAPTARQDVTVVKESPVPATEPPVVREEKPETKPAAAVVVPSPSVAPAEKPQPEVSPNDVMVHPDLLRNSTVLLTLYNPTNNMQIDGEVEIVDAERAKLLAKVKGNDLITLPDPKSKSGKLLLISNSFGFRKVQHELNYKSTAQDSLPAFMDVIDNHYRIKFDMSKLHRGDIAVLYNVYFYNDAAIMQPESQYELNKLLQMMKDSPTLKITLHGHTNGNAAGKIITMSNDKDFFTLTSDAKHGFGSAKELSRVRAQVIKDWLISNQIAADRIEVQAHGGKRMIHDKNGPNAKRNVRVEVEITQE
jgi:outer membrane protein OmpA-like peptidoglycan-associated protein